VFIDPEGKRYAHNRTEEGKEEGISVVTEADALMR
jgi:hypothetical protein